jgi:hypothetical protein
MKNLDPKTTNTPRNAGQKAVVHYTMASGEIRVGRPAMVKPVDHTSAFVTNTSLVITSKVLKIDRETGEFETENSLYRRLQGGRQ